MPKSYRFTFQCESLRKLMYEALKSLGQTWSLSDKEVIELGLLAIATLNKEPGKVEALVNRVKGEHLLENL